MNEEMQNGEDTLIQSSYTEINGEVVGIVPPTGGADESPQDERNWQHSSMSLATQIPEKFRIEYATTTHQRKVGVCTADGITQMATKYYGIRMSRDFQYAMQKMNYDGNWYEGSSLLSALSIGKNIGFVPVTAFPDIIDANPNIDYNQYLEILKARLTTEKITELKTIAAQYRIKGYAAVGTDPSSLAKGIVDSNGIGLYVRYNMTTDWWMKNGQYKYLYADLCDITNNTNYTGGHALIQTGYDHSRYTQGWVTNSWGDLWCYPYKGHGSMDLKITTPTEAWIIYWNAIPGVAPVTPQVTTAPFTRTLVKGMANADVKRLQNWLKENGYMDNSIPSTGYFGDKTFEAVKKLQIDKQIAIPPTGNFGEKTRKYVNSTITTSSIMTIENDTIKRYAISSGVTFATTFLTILATNIASITPETFTTAGIASILMVAARAGIKATVEKFSTPKDLTRD